MKQFRGFAAAVLMSLPGACAFAQTSVGAGCVGSVDNNTGTYTSRAAGGCDTTPPPAQSSGPSFTPAQQMQLDAAYGVGSAIGSAFASWLFSPPAHHDNQGAMQAIRQRQHAEFERHMLDRQRERQEHEAALASMKGDAGPADFEMKGLGNAGALSVADAHYLETLKNQVRTLDCGMGEIYAAAEATGPSGQAFASGLAEDVLNAERGLTESPLPTGDACEVVALHRDFQEEGGNHKGTQMIVDVGGTRFPNGQSTLTIMSHITGPDGRRIETQSIVVLNAAGTVDCEEVTPAASSCLKKARLAGGIFSGKRYCPRPPPDNFANKGYSACATPTATGDLK